MRQRDYRSVPPQIVATVMVLQRWHGLPDRDAVEAFEFDARWKYACDGLDFDYPGFAHTMLVYTRARLAASDQPRRIFDVTLDAARAAGVVSAKQVLDSTPVYDAVATQDTVTMIRSAVRQLLASADTELEVELGAVLTRDDDYRSAGKPDCDWDDAAAREQLVADLAADAHACLAVIDGRNLDDKVEQVSELLATVIGQDLEETGDGTFRIAQRVAKDRVISTVDPDARHGHKTAARGFDGYKGHIAEDPDSEIITDTTVTAGNAGDASVAETLIEDLLGNDGGDETPEVYGDAAYGTGEFQQRLEEDNIDSACRTQPPAALKGRFGKDQFTVDLETGTVICSNRVSVTIRRAVDGSGIAYFVGACRECPLGEEVPKRQAVRRSGLGSTKLSSPEPACVNKTPSGKRITGLPVPGLNANLVI